MSGTRGPGEPTSGGGTPAWGTPAGGTPAGDTPAGDTPAWGTPAWGTPAWGTPPGQAPATPPGSCPPERDDVTAYVVRPPSGNVKAYAQGGVVGVALMLAGLVYGYGLFSVFALLLAWPMARQFVTHRPGTVWFTADAQGVYFGRVDAVYATVPLRDAPIRWSWIDSVVVFPVTRLRHEGDGVAFRTVTEQVTGVGVTRRGDPGGRRVRRRRPRRRRTGTDPGRPSDAGTRGGTPCVTRTTHRSTRTPTAASRSCSPGCRDSSNWHTAVGVTRRGDPRARSQGTIG
jgi:hypothetical protein